jgi:hypothetical protein
VAERKLRLYVISAADHGHVETAPSPCLSSPFIYNAAVRRLAPPRRRSL